MLLTYKYKLYANDKNKHLTKQLQIACNVYNHCIALHKKHYDLFHKSLDKYRLQKHITKLKQRTKKFWNEINSQTIQDITERIDKAYKLFFSNLKKGIKTAPPKFKPFRKYKSITFKTSGFKVMEDNRIKILNKVYKYHKSRELNGTVKTMSVKRDSLGDYYIYFVIESNLVFSPLKPLTGNIAGFDFGLKTFLTSSEGDKIESPRFFFSEMDTVRKLSKRLSKKVKGSNNRKKALMNLARMHKRIINKRRDWFFKLSIELVGKYNGLIYEDLNLKGMQKLWGRKICDLAFAEYIEIQKFICVKRGTHFLKNNRFERSTTICSECGCYNPNLTLKDRNWTCKECGAHHDRDENAASNIKRVGVSTLASEVVSPALVG